MALRAIGNKKNLKNDDDEEIYDGCDGRKKGMLKKK